MSKIFVLGHKGMLGHTLVRHLSCAGHAVVTSESRYAALPDDALIADVRASNCDWIINAIGAIPQKQPDNENLYRSNTLLPLHLLNHLGEHQRLLHASTDCVFSGKRGGYRSSDRRDCADVYGLSKAMGEAIALDARAICLRVSIVGPELGSSRGLLEWFLHQSGPVKGFTNHIWNGITTLEWAKAADEVIRQSAPYSRGLVQLGVKDAITKYELLRLFAEIWGQNGEITPVEAPLAVDRSLVPDWLRPPLRDQLIALKEWMQSTPS